MSNTLEDKADKSYVNGRISLLPASSTVTLNARPSIVIANSNSNINILLFTGGTTVKGLHSNDTTVKASVASNIPTSKPSSPNLNSLFYIWHSSSGAMQYYISASATVNWILLPLT